MRTWWVFLLGALGARAAAPSATWSWVSAADPARALDALAVPSSAGEDVVRLVRAPVAGVREPADRKVTGFGLPVPDLTPPPPDPAPPQRLRETSPPGPLWPNPDGVISEPKPGSESGPRNPWEIRLRARTKGKTSEFMYAGFIAGGPSGPVGMLNGRGWTLGCSVEGFTIERIVPAGVVLLRNGVSYVVPVGRKIAIQLLNP